METAKNTHFALHHASDRTDGLPTRERCETWISELRGLPTAMGAVAYCAHLGFDYAEMKRRVHNHSDAV